MLMIYMNSITNITNLRLSGPPSDGDLHLSTSWGACVCVCVCMSTPSSHSKNSLSKICSKDWVAQKPFFDR